ncbi:hypothetical protein MMG03_003115 [Fibrobacter succinogenes]|nr:hypothetical protein [Fibrobacter succinogenes]
MFCTAHIKVDGHPVLFKFLGQECVTVAGVDIAEVVPAGTSPLRHGVSFADTLAAISVNNVQPFSCVGQRRLTAVTRLVVLQVRQLHGEFCIVDGRDFAIFPVDDGERFAPLHLGVPHWRGSGYILGAATFASLAARLLKPSPWSRPQGVTIPNAEANIKTYYDNSLKSKTKSSLFIASHRR